MKNFFKINFSTKNIKRDLSSQLIQSLILNIILLGAQYLYLNLRFEFINDTVPFWYTQPWGDKQLAPKNLLYLLPLISGLIVVGGSILAIIADKRHMRYGRTSLLVLATLWNIVMSVSLVRIILKASSPFPPLIDPELLIMLVPFFFSFFVSRQQPLV